MLTASNVKKLFTKAHAPANNDTSRTLAHELLAQRLTNHIEAQYWSDDMLRGNAEEIIARNTYSNTRAKVEEVGFITREMTHDGVTFTIGWSPDGLVGADGSIEVKSRAMKFQARTIIEGGCPDEFLLQIQTGLLVSGRKWMDFVSVCGGMHMYVYRVLPDGELQKKILDTAAKFEKLLQLNETKYRKNSKGMEVTERIIEQEMVI
jgi:predicted phage-related endonuclease